MRKFIAILLTIIIALSIWWIGYDHTHSIWLGLLFIPMVIIVSSIGALLGIFILKAFNMYN